MKLEEKKPNARYADYISKAEKAEEMAALATDEIAQNSFRMVAEGWRRLADLARRQPPQ